jgi:hypothetical protein
MCFLFWDYLNKFYRLGDGTIIPDTDAALVFITEFVDIGLGEVEHTAVAVDAYHAIRFKQKEQLPIAMYLQFLLGPQQEVPEPKAVSAVAKFLHP